MLCYRDTLLWMKAVDLMRSLKPKLLAPQHTRPVEVSEKIDEILTAYRDAIQVRGSHFYNRRSKEEAE